MQKKYTGGLNRAETKFERFCFWFTAVDLLFFPYFTFFSVSFSVPIIAVWMALRVNKKIRDREVRITLLIVYTMMLSTLIGVIYTGSVRFETTFFTSVKRLFQYTLSFGYYFFFKSYFQSRRVNMPKLILVFLVNVALFATVFHLLPEQYATVKMALNPADNHTRRYLLNMVHYRFNYLWTDPNNIAYLVGGLVCWYFLLGDSSFMSKMLLLSLSFFIILSTQSNGGLFVLASVVFILVLRTMVKWLKRANIKASSVLMIFFLMFIVLTIFTLTDQGTHVYETFIRPVETRFSYYVESPNISGGRFAALRGAQEYFHPIFLIIGSGKEWFTYENG